MSTLKDIIPDNVKDIIPDNALKNMSDDHKNKFAELLANNDIPGIIKLIFQVIISSTQTNHDRQHKTLKYSKTFNNNFINVIVNHKQELFNVLKKELPKDLKPKLENIDQQVIVKALNNEDVLNKIKEDVNAAVSDKAGEANGNNTTENTEDNQEAPIDNQEKNQAAPIDNQDAPIDNQAAPIDNQDAPIDNQDAPIDNQAVTVGNQEEKASQNLPEPSNSVANTNTTPKEEIDGGKRRKRNKTRRTKKRKNARKTRKKTKRKTKHKNRKSTKRKTKRSRK